MSLISTARPTTVQPHETPTKPHRISPARIALFPARTFLALGWIRAGVEKLIDTNWWDGTYLRSFLDDKQDTMLPFLTPATDIIGARTAVLVSFIVLILELAIGVCLITGRRLPHALAFATALNLAFVALGAVTPSAFYLVLQMTLLFALYLRRPDPSPWRERIAIGLSLAAATALTPFIRTIHPHEVIQDPAIMLATLAILTAATLTVVIVEGADDRHGYRRR
jgi:uncharacterized membrane protein YphA (DoxX/SURF4 family)